MANLSTTYMGLQLKNPIIIASSGMSKSLKKLKSGEEAGAGAIVLKSLFEEALDNDDMSWDSATMVHTEAYDYLQAEVNLQYGPEEYCDLIRNAKKEIAIPIIASINCISAKWWPEFAKKIEAAGADALELNIFPLYDNVRKSSSDIEEMYFEILKSVRSAVEIPIAIKLSDQFTALSNFAARLTGFGANALTLFNRFVEPDIDIDKISLKTTFPFTTSDDIHKTLRWVSLLKNKTVADLSATTGVHSTESVIKLLLSGAATIQIASVLYKKGFKVVDEMLKALNEWMDDKGFENISDFNGQLAFSKSDNADIYLRTQFMEKTRFAESK
jgi:dihydroorotate dehydrogenase (fumarate)